MKNLDTCAGEFPNKGVELPTEFLEVSIFSDGPSVRLYGSKLDHF